jgi:hypothetical protein
MPTINCAGMMHRDAAVGFDLGLQVLPDFHKTVGGANYRLVHIPQTMGPMLVVVAVDPYVFTFPGPL